MCPLWNGKSIANILVNVDKVNMLRCCQVKNL